MDDESRFVNAITTDCTNFYGLSNLIFMNQLNCDNSARYFASFIGVNL